MSLDRPAVRKALARWFSAHARDLPWRRDRDPYRVWISEAMLQQTQVVTVVPYFERFLARFPTIAALAAAPLEDVLRLWEGLGYYSRARNLHRAAQTLVAEHAGAFPQSVEATSALPGFGRYTTNAVLSQAFEMRLPILEANSVRVLCRLHGIDDDPTAPAVRERLWTLSEELLPNAGIGDFNQALMELGATVCTPRNPACATCPLARACAAQRDGTVDVIPRKKTPPKIETVREVALVVARGSQVLLARRPATGRWALLWEFPHVALEPGQSVEDGALALAATLGFAIGEPSDLITVRHAVTRFRITLTAFRADWVSGAFVPGSWPEHAWVEPTALADYPVSRPQRRLADAVRDGSSDAPLFNA